MKIYNAVSGSKEIKMLELIRADVDQNNKITLTDALLMLKYLARQDKEVGVEVSEAIIAGEKVVVEGETINLKAEIYPKDATYDKMEWKSKNTNIATVDSKTGIVIGKRVGKTSIVLKIDDVEVNEHPIEVIEKEDDGKLSNKSEVNVIKTINCPNILNNKSNGYWAIYFNEQPDVKNIKMNANNKYKCSGAVAMYYANVILGRKPSITTITEDYVLSSNATKTNFPGGGYEYLECKSYDEQIETIYKGIIEGKPVPVKVKNNKGEDTYVLAYAIKGKAAQEGKILAEDIAVIDSKTGAYVDLDEYYAYTTGSNEGVYPLAIYKGEVVKLKVDTSSGGKVDLKLREVAGTSAKVIERLAHDSYVYTTKENVKGVINANGYEWIKVTSQSGKQGFVAKKYLKEYNGKKYESEFDSYNIKFEYEGTINGYLGIDVAPGSSVTKANFEKLIKGQLTIPGKTIGRSDIGNFSPAFVYLKFGATGWGVDFSIAKSTTYANVASFIKICEKYKIPYGGYYYSQAITIEEAKKEVEYIKEIYNKAENELGELKYNVLPFAIDIELGGSSSYTGRMLRYIRNGGEKSELTKTKNFLTNEVGKLKQVDKTIIYTDRNALRELITFKNFDEKNKELWMVDPIGTPVHSKDIANNGYLPYVRNRQIKLDYTLVNGCCMDINLMNKDVYEELIQKINT